MLIIPKNQLDKYKLHKVVLYEYNKYINETCIEVKNISNRLSTYDQSPLYKKNTKRISRNLFPSFQKQLNKILLEYSEEFGFVETN
jgi:hypothetical protein